MEPQIPLTPTLSDKNIPIPIPVPMDVLNGHEAAKEEGRTLSEVDVKKTVENKGNDKMVEKKEGSDGDEKQKMFLVLDIIEAVEGIEEEMDGMIAEGAERKGLETKVGAEEEKNLLKSEEKSSGEGKEVEDDIAGDVSKKDVVNSADKKGEKRKRKRKRKKPETETSEGLGKKGKANQEENSLGSEEVKKGEESVKEKGVDESEEGKGNLEGEDKGMESGERKKKKVKVKVKVKATASANIGMKSARKPEPSEGFDWLPEGWLIEHRPRPSGSRLIDRYYYSPDCQQFRSKNEVLYFLENGTKRGVSKVLSKNKDTSNNSTGKEQPKDDVPTSKRSASKVVSKNKDMSNNSKGKEHLEDDMLASKRKRKAKRKALEFDINNPPEEVIWVNDPNLGAQLTPFVGSDHVSIESKTEWAEALISLKGGS